MQRRSSSKGGSAPVALALALASSAAHGQPQPQPAGIDALLHEGVELRRGHRDLEALAVFRRAYDQSRGPRALAQMALAEQALGRWVEAETHLLAALAAPDPWIARSRATLEAALAAIGRHLGGLWVEGGVPGAEVLLDGERIAVLPLTEPVRVVAGSLTVAVRATGYGTVTRHVIVPPGGDAREEVRLARLAEDSVQGSGTAPSSPPRAPSARPHAAASGGTQRALAWAAGAGAIAGVGVGLTFLILREGDVSAFNDSSCPPMSDPMQPGNCAAMLDAVRADEAVAMASFLAGGALTVTSILLFATAPPRGRERTAWLGCARGPGTIGVTCGGRF